jgi:putative endonuclease
MRAQIYFLYIILCDKSHYYTGITTDTERRFVEHVSGQKKAAKYTKGRKELVLVYTVELGAKPIAYKIEYYVKKLPHCKKQKIVEMQMDKQSLFTYLQNHFAIGDI